MGIFGIIAHRAARYWLAYCGSAFTSYGISVFWFHEMWFGNSPDQGMFLCLNIGAVLMLLCAVAHFALSVLEARRESIVIAAAFGVGTGFFGYWIALAV